MSVRMVCLLIVSTDACEWEISKQYWKYILLIVGDYNIVLFCLLLGWDQLSFPQLTNSHGMS